MELEKYKMPNGVLIQAIPNDLITKRIKQFGVYEFSLYTFLKDYLTSTSEAVCIDIGANIGNHSMTMARYGKTVHSFEPVPFIFKVLSENKAINDFSNLNLHNIALGNENSEVEMMIVNENNSGQSRISEKYVGQPPGKKVIAQQVKGDDFFEKLGLDRLDLIKIDVEGHETQALLGLMETIKKHKPLVIFEWNDLLTKQGFSDHNLFESLFNEYSLYELTDNQTDYRRKTDGQFFRSIKRKIYNHTHEYKSCFRKIENLEKNYGSLILVPKDRWDQYGFDKNDKFLVS